MRAAIFREYGPPEVVRVEEVPEPPLGPGQVRVGVRAAAVNYPDVLLVANQYQITVPTPFVPGSEFAGVVSEVADDVIAITALGQRPEIFQYLRDRGGASVGPPRIRELVRRGRS